MDKYKLIKELGLQVFTKPLGNDVMLVSADELASILNQAGRRNYSGYSVIDLIVKHKPKSLEAKILDILNDSNKSTTKVLCEIGELIEVKHD